MHVYRGTHKAKRSSQKINFQEKRNENDIELFVIRKQKQELTEGIKGIS